jgi:hypothetical protein
LGRQTRTGRFVETALQRNRRKILVGGRVGMFTAFYLHVGPFSRLVVKAIERQIPRSMPGSGKRRSPTPRN